jgi:hypothetical protein
LEYAVVTANGLHDRYGMSLADWQNLYHAEIIYELKRSISLVSSDPATYDSWYLVRFRP